jgi:hypothetical protein
MALVVSSVPVSFPTGVRCTTGTITFDASYLAAGETITAAQFGGGANGIPSALPDFVILTNKKATPTTAVVPVYDKAGGKVHLYNSTTGAPLDLVEIATTVDESLQIFAYLAFWTVIDPSGVVTV